jgi:hypothetical protein
MQTNPKMKTWLLVSLMSLAIFSPATQADARGGGGHGRGGGGGCDPFLLPALVGLGLIIGGLGYACAEDRYDRTYETRYIVVPTPVSPAYTMIPPNCQPLIVNGVRYYTVNGITYMYTTAGYQVVAGPPPVVVRPPEPAASAHPPIVSPAGAPAAPAVNAEDSFTINVPNSTGGYTAVTLRRSGKGFVGPQGEYYTEFPRIAQLKVMYAK